LVQALSFEAEKPEKKRTRGMSKTSDLKTWVEQPEVVSFQQVSTRSNRGKKRDQEHINSNHTKARGCDARTGAGAYGESPHALGGGR